MCPDDAKRNRQSGSSRASYICEMEIYLRLWRAEHDDIGVYAKWSVD